MFISKLDKDKAAEICNQTKIIFIYFFAFSLTPNSYINVLEPPQKDNQILNLKKYRILKFKI